MDAPKRIYLELNNVPPCNFGALWYEDEVPGGVAYRLESEVNEELAAKNEQIAKLQAIILMERANRRSLFFDLRGPSPCSGDSPSQGTRESAAL